MISLFYSPSLRVKNFVNVMSKLNWPIKVNSLMNLTTLINGRKGMGVFPLEKQTNPNKKLRKAKKGPLPYSVVMQDSSKSREGHLSLLYCAKIKMFKFHPPNEPCENTIIMYMN